MHMYMHYFKMTEYRSDQVNIEHTFLTRMVKCYLFGFTQLTSKVICFSKEQHMKETSTVKIKKNLESDWEFIF